MMNDDGLWCAQLPICRWTLKRWSESVSDSVPKRAQPD
jgi:hypothetical protein